MKNMLMAFVLSLVLLAGSTVHVAAAPVANPLDQLTGTVWMNSTPDNKVSLIYGVECAVAVEYFVAAEMAKNEGSTAAPQKKDVLNSLTLFPKAWISVFDGMNREKIVEAINNWYSEHPDQWNRPVFNVLWYEVMQPKLNKR